jgi:hypothetical protein
VRLERLGLMKNKITSKGIEPATFRLEDPCYTQQNHPPGNSGTLRHITPHPLRHFDIQALWAEIRACVGSGEWIQLALRYTKHSPFSCSKCPCEGKRVLCPLPPLKYGGVDIKLHASLGSTPAVLSSVPTDGSHTPL